jgi:hypothetical protein
MAWSRSRWLSIGVAALGLVVGSGIGAAGQLERPAPDTTTTTVSTSVAAEVPPAETVTVTQTETVTRTQTATQSAPDPPSATPPAAPTDYPGCATPDDTANCVPPDPGGDTTTFCDSHQCIDNFDYGTGDIVQCGDGMWSQSGGNPGACSYHGGEAGYP